MTIPAQRIAQIESRHAELSAEMARPDLPAETVYWRLHFALGMVHNNRFVEFDRLHHLSGGQTREGDVGALLKRMLDFAEAGFQAA